MKILWVGPLIIISIVVATWLHVNKKNGNYIEDNIDQLAAALHDIDKVLPEHTNIGIRQYNVDDYLWCRYLLAPRYCSMDIHERLDTILSICKTDASDSIIHVITDHKKQIWTASDKQYRYFLTSNQ